MIFDKQKIIYINAIAIFLLLYSVNSVAYFDVQRKGSTKSEMNGIGSHDFGDFTKSWRLVTVRYREDTGEMRFTYANDIAWKAMQSLKPSYPDGAVFGKVALLTEKDPNFQSSKVPSGNRRFQLMVRDKKRYSSTDGWGYALFDPNGNTFPEDLKATTTACAACHRIVAGLDYVFSRPAALSVFSTNEHNFSSSLIAAKSLFKEQKRPSIPSKLAKLVTENFKNFYSLEGELRKNAFSGTLDEVIPFLQEQVKKTSSPSYLFVNENNFSLVQPLKPNKCTAEQTGYRILIVFNNKTVRETELCK